MLKESKMGKQLGCDVDWSLAPEGTVFYAEGYFRDNLCNFWDENGGVWMRSLYTREQLLQANDYEPNPEVKNVDWSKHPEGAQFFSNGHFRKHKKIVGEFNRDSDFFEYKWDDGEWELTIEETLEEHEDYIDFEMNPKLIYDRSLDDKWDNGELGRDEGFVKVSDISINTPIKSDGGSSSYYDIQLPDWLFDKIYERRYSENCYIKTEELIEVMGSDFDLSNIIKCSVRINSLKNGVGKAGNDVTYDANKIIYSAGRLKERDKR